MAIPIEKKTVKFSRPPPGGVISVPAVCAASPGATPFNPGCDTPDAPGTDEAGRLPMLATIRPFHHGTENDNQKHQAADNGDQTTKPHQAHGDNFFQAIEGLLGAGYLALHAITA